MKKENQKTKNIIGIIAEYNPFHNGHIYQLNWIKENFNNPYIIVALTNNYTQRGEKHITTFKERKRIAKKYGVSKVIKLDDKIATQAAHIFANHGVIELNKHKITHLVFGSETNNVDLFIKIAQTIKNNPSEYNKLVKQYLKKGANSFPRATNLALQDLLGEDISLPNDILGLEYVKTIVNNELDIIPVSIQRTIPFHSQETENNFASATKIRNMVKNNEDVSKYTPMKLEYSDKNDIANTYPKFKKFILKSTSDKIARYKMVDEGMENLFKKQVMLSENYEDFIQNCTSRRYTSSRIKRAYLSILTKNKKEKSKRLSWK
ncbi:nucleotidyltransferase [Mycoplasma sp. Pen4]|uniref:nucleotidyltransferase n=1 Tax=Mycoplasma sp. Pen4 TaxID=640330 RepID=UPI001654B1F0|nr:nucleotidyltransferase [Mycoplasma sp. Pen4]QNM93314.1 nucleotidyltransferase [Mycoplasma sp. Pen4]